MDLNSIISTALSSDAVKNIAKKSGATAKETSSVLSAALPMLLNGMKQQASDETTGFADALSNHANNSTDNITSFIKNIDIADGAKIINHLLGSNTSEETSAIAKESGVSKAKTSNILSTVAPLLMSLLGQQTQNDNSSSNIGSLVSSLLGNVDLGSIISSLVSSNSSSNSGSGILGLLKSFLGKK